MSNQPFNAAQHPRIGDGTFTATAHSDDVPALTATDANRFAEFNDVRSLDAAAHAALSPTGSDPEHDSAVRAQWEDRRTHLVNASQRRTYDEYATALEEQARTQLANAARANLRNIADELREAHPDVAVMVLDKDDDDGDLAVGVYAVQDKDGNDLPEAHDAWGFAQELVSQHSSRQLARFTEGPIDLGKAAAWYPDGGLHIRPRH